MYTLVLVALLNGVLALGISWATSNSVSLTGYLKVRGATIVDPPSDEPDNTHVEVVITGAAAKVLYETMRVQSSRDECLGSASFRKSISGLTCIHTHEDDSYECDFAIEVETAQIVPGRVC